MRRPILRVRRLIKRALITLITLILVAVVAFNVSPWPSAMVIRYVFEKGAERTRDAMEAHAPDGITSILDEPYRQNDDDATLNVFFPENTADGTNLPTLIWTHGGAWISGHKDDATPYFELIAAAGFTVISLGYSVGPEEKYPTAVYQINDAHAYILANADRFHVDAQRIVLAGDSAGAQLSSQLAALITNPDYASAMGITPALQPGQLRGVGLFCGIYDMSTFGQASTEDLSGADQLIDRLLVWGVGSVLWAYTGERGGDDKALEEMSTIDHVTTAFPPSFVTGGNADPLTNTQSIPMAAKLEDLGVPVTTMFFPDDYPGNLPHLYQFNLDTEDGQKALSEFIAFLQATLQAGSSQISIASPQGE